MLGIFKHQTVYVLLLCLKIPNYDKSKYAFQYTLVCVTKFAKLPWLLHIRANVEPLGRHLSMILVYVGIEKYCLDNIGILVKKQKKTIAKASYSLIFCGYNSL